MKFRMHIAGPDDIEDFDDELEALRRANGINKWWLDRRGKDPENEPLCCATVNVVLDESTADAGRKE